jgi:hypothetical protein
MRRAVSVFVVAVVMGVFFIATAPGASAANAKGCSGSGVSISEDGDVIDNASAPGKGGTKDNPFDIEVNGKVKYNYKVNGNLTGGRWNVVIDLGFFLPDVKFGGSIKSASTTGTGTEPIKKHLKVGGLAAFVGLMKADIVATNGKTRCTVSGWIKLHASVLTTPAFYLALILLVIAILLLYFGMGRPGGVL